MENKEKYKKYRRMLSSQKKMLVERRKDLKEAADLMDAGLKKFESKGNLANIKYALVKKKGLKLVIFIKLRVKELKESIGNLEGYVSKHEND